MKKYFIITENINKKLKKKHIEAHKLHLLLVTYKNHHRCVPNKYRHPIMLYLINDTGTKVISIAYYCMILTLVEKIIFILYN